MKVKRFEPGTFSVYAIRWRLDALPQTYVIERGPTGTVLGTYRRVSDPGELDLIYTTIAGAGELPLYPLTRPRVVT